MTQARAEVPSELHTRFLIRLGAQIKVKKPRIVAVKSITIIPIKRMIKGKPADYEATVVGVGVKGEITKFKLIHLEECTWIFA